MSSILEYIPTPGPTGPAVISKYAYIQNCFDSKSLFFKNILVQYHFSLTTSRSIQLLYGVFRSMQLLDTSTAQNISHELTKAQNYHAHCKIARPIRSSCQAQHQKSCLNSLIHKNAQYLCITNSIIWEEMSPSPPTWPTSFSGCFFF